jgi:hypothetical protein
MMIYNRKLTKIIPGKKSTLPTEKLKIVEDIK